MTVTGPGPWKGDARIAWVAIVVLALVFAAMRGIGVQGPPRFRFLLPLGFVLMTLLPWVWMTRQGRVEIGLGRPRDGAWFAWAALLGAAASLLCFLIGFGLFGRGIDNWYISVARNFAQTAPAASTPRLYLMFTATAMVFSPLGEELFFRGVFQRALEERLGTHAGTWIECTVFAAVHVFHHGVVIDALGFHGLSRSAPLWLLLMLAVAHLFAWLRRQGGSLYLAMAAHSAFNFMMGTCIFLVLWPPQGGYA